MAPSFSPKQTPTRATSSSRLLSMKFMNRLGSSDPTTSSPLAATPEKDAKQPIDNSPSVKKRDTTATTTKEEDDAEHEESFVTEHDNDDQGHLEASMQAAVRANEARREEAVAQRAAALGDEHWTWTVPLPPHIAAAMQKTQRNTTTTPQKMSVSSTSLGYAEIDQVSTKPEIRRYNMKEETASSLSGDDTTPSSRKRGRTDSDATSGKKKKKTEHVKLSKLTSLSSAGESSSSNIQCHRCGQMGHKQAACPATDPRRKKTKKR